MKMVNFRQGELNLLVSSDLQGPHHQDPNLPRRLQVKITLASNALLSYGLLSSYLSGTKHKSSVILHRYVDVTSNVRGCTAGIGMAGSQERSIVDVAGEAR
jgi:hypothetical protein